MSTILTGGGSALHGTMDGTGTGLGHDYTGVASPPKRFLLVMVSSSTVLDPTVPQANFYKVDDLDAAPDPGSFPVDFTDTDGVTTLSRIVFPSGETDTQPVMWVGIGTTWDLLDDAAQALAVTFNRACVAYLTVFPIEPDTPAYLNSASSWLLSTANIDVSMPALDLTDRYDAAVLRFLGAYAEGIDGADGTHDSTGGIGWVDVPGVGAGLAEVPAGATSMSVDSTGVPLLTLTLAVSSGIPEHAPDRVAEVEFFLDAQPSSRDIYAPDRVARCEFYLERTVPLDLTPRDWRAVIVDSTGTQVARCAHAHIGELTQTLSDTHRVTVTIPLLDRTGAPTRPASTIADTDVVPDLELQVWRDGVLWQWGPIVDVEPDGAALAVTVHDPTWHLSRRHLGKMGHEFGGYTDFTDPVVNPRFDTGDLTGWSLIRCQGYNLTATPDPDAVTLSSRKLPDGTRMIRADGPIDVDDSYQLYQDLDVLVGATHGDTRVTLSGWWWIPSDGEFAPNNLRFGLLLARIPRDADLPVGYFTPTDTAFSTLDDTVPRERLVRHTCDITIPAGAQELLHVAVCFPQGVSYFGGLTLHGDDGVDYVEYPPAEAAANLINVYGAVSTIEERSDVNVTAIPYPTGIDRITRTFRNRDHPGILDSVNQWAREHWFEWEVLYTSTDRIMRIAEPTVGTGRRAAAIRLDADGHGNVVSIRRARRWSSGATVVETQTLDDHVARAARLAGDHVTIEEISAGHRDPNDYDLARQASLDLDTLAHPDQLEVVCRPGDTRWLTAVRLGDRFHVHSTWPGSEADEYYRLVRREITPAADQVTLTLNPYVEAT